MARWSIQESEELYNVSRWGEGFFKIGDNGHLIASPKGKTGGEIDLKNLIMDLDQRGIYLPVLLRFNDILAKRIADIHGAFADSMREYNYRGNYRLVVPIKVNQQKHVVEELLAAGKDFHVGLEAGSKPELLAAIAMIDDPEAIIVCNGYKDFEYLETALLSNKLGRKTIIICDRYQEIVDLVKLKRERGLVGPIGVRAKLSAKGAGRWAESGGEFSKFGLTSMEIVHAVRLLSENGMLDQLRCVHFHIGSQITAIRAVKGAIREASRIFVDLYRMGAKLEYLDVGGGLAVDYDGSKTNFSSSMNYSMLEYASDIVSEVGDTCERAGVPKPTILSESGRALMAHHSVLVFDVLGVNEISRQIGDPPEIAPDDPEILREIAALNASVTVKNFSEVFHDVSELKDRATDLFNLGYVSLTQRAKAEEYYWACIRTIVRITDKLDYVPEELAAIKKRLYDTYFCNFSVFQSVPDHWAVKALFPIMPIHRLTEKPSRRGIVADLTCDSDGKICEFIDLHDVSTTLPLHRFDGRPYYLGVFLVGAYQETLGDLHNLFGDTNAVHVSLSESGGYRIHHHVIGDTVADVLGYVEYDPKELVRRVRMATEKSLDEGRMTFDEVRQLMKRYETGLSGYTYLEGEDQMLPETAGASAALTAVSGVKPHHDTGVAAITPANGNGGNGAHAAGQTAGPELRESPAV